MTNEQKIQEKYMQIGFLHTKELELSEELRHVSAAKNNLLTELSNLEKQIKSESKDEEIVDSEI